MDEMHAAAMPQRPQEIEDRTDEMLVIGAGPVGLAMAKALKDQGIPHDHVEADEAVGGNWRHGVYDTVHIISSRRTTEFPDFPMPEGTPDFPSREDMRRYLEAYAVHYGLNERIRFATRVIAVRPVENNRWEVHFADGGIARYKGVLVCNGHHWCRRMPDYPGEFAGEMIHSKDYRRPEQLAGRRVLVIGGGNSACDIVSEAARVAREAHLSLRRGYWFMPKTFFGVPTVELIHPRLPVFAQRLLLKALIRVAIGDYRRYGLPKPDHDLFERHPTISTEILHYLKHGRIHPHPDIACFEGRRAHFQDGTSAELDMIVAATGYHVAYPFLPAALCPVEGPVLKVYGGSMLPGYRHLYLIGWGQPRYGFGPLVAPAAELMARIIRLQDEIEHPLADVLKAMGARPPETHLADPHRQMRQIRRAMRRLGLVRLFARHLMRGSARPNPVLPAPDISQLAAQRDMPVY
ncbi:MAG: NAD(P)/FAD-dependent oxidoreductase [Alphaproteobacteria bacterium]|nr:MAG: NAD(P)/FAD-dependent oxidoreductase [Alphaproteobacteria bacterium]